MNAMTAMNINGKKAVFAYGTFEPINDTNTKLIRKMVTHAKNTGADPYIIVTHTGSGVNAKKPKLAELFPNVTIMGTSKKEPTLGYIVNRLRTNKNYKTIEMVARTNAVKKFKKFVNVNKVVNSKVSKPKPVSMNPKPKPKPVSMKRKTQSKSSKGVTKRKTQSIRTTTNGAVTKPNPKPNPKPKNSNTKTKPKPKPKNSNTKTKPKNSKGVTMSTSLDRNMRALERMMMKNMF